MCHIANTGTRVNQLHINSLLFLNEKMRLQENCLTLYHDFPDLCRNIKLPAGKEFPEMQLWGEWGEYPGIVK